MAELQHTPGPWTYNEHSANRITGPHGETIAATYGGFVGVEEQVSNTRLIAGVPAMHEYMSKMAATGDEEAKAILSEL